jgi:hypothetical protein
VGVNVKVSDGVTEAVPVGVGETGMMITVEVADGMNEGVGDRIAGRGDGKTNGVVTGKEIFQALHPASKIATMIAGILLIIPILQS